MLFATGCAGLRPADDGFRAKLASGCQSDAACNALEAEAYNRYTRCNLGNGGPCDAFLADRTEARRLQADERKGREAARDGEIVQRRQASEASQRELAHTVAMQNDPEQRRKDDVAKEATRLEQKVLVDADLEQKCAPTREARLKAWHAARNEKLNNDRRNAVAEEWAEKHCKRVEVKDYSRRLCDDGSAVAKMCNVETGSHSELRCPPGAPKDVGTGIHTGGKVQDRYAWAAYQTVGSLGVNCHDMPNDELPY